MSWPYQLTPAHFSKSIGNEARGSPQAVEYGRTPLFVRGAFRDVLSDAGQVTAIGPPFDPVAPLMGAGEKM
jgi:hypothetical protein